MSHLFKRPEKWIFLFWLLSVMILYQNVGGVASQLHGKKNNSENVNIIIHRGKEKTYVQRNSKLFNAIISESERFLVTAEGALLEAVTTQVIESVKDDFAIELIYPKSKELRIEFSKSTLKFNRLLVPLSGKYAPNTIFYGLDEYSSGPLFKNLGNQRIKELIETCKGLD